MKPLRKFCDWQGKFSPFAFRRRVFAAGYFVHGEIRYRYHVGDTEYVVRRVSL